MNIQFCQSPITENPETFINVYKNQLICYRWECLGMLRNNAIIKQLVFLLLIQLIIALTACSKKDILSQAPESIISTAQSETTMFNTGTGVQDKQYPHQTSSTTLSIIEGSDESNRISTTVTRTNTPTQTTVLSNIVFPPVGYSQDGNIVLESIKAINNTVILVFKNVNSKMETDMENSSVKYTCIDADGNVSVSGVLKLGRIGAEQSKEYRVNISSNISKFELSDFSIEYWACFS